jgi:hypothetical protein
MEGMEFDDNVQIVTMEDIEKPFCKATALISKINNSLPLFPGGMTDSKYSNQELVSLMEWSLLSSSRAKFSIWTATFQPRTSRPSWYSNVKQQKYTKKVQRISELHKNLLQQSRLFLLQVQPQQRTQHAQLLGA